MGGAHGPLYKKPAGLKADLNLIESRTAPPGN